MKDVSRNDGRTVLFVSHHMGTIAQLCNSVLILNKGEVFRYTSNALAGIEEYSRLNRTGNSFVNESETKSLVSVKKISMLNAYSEEASEFDTREAIQLKFTLDYDNIPAGTSMLVTIVNQHKMPVFSEEVEITSKEISLTLRKNFLVQGLYSINVICHLLPTDEYYKAEDICPFSVLDTSSPMIIYNNYNYNYGSVFGDSVWETGK